MAPRYKVSEAMAEGMRDLARKGIAYATIARRYKVSVSTVHAHVKRLSAAPPPAKPARTPAVTGECTTVDEWLRAGGQITYLPAPGSEELVRRNRKLIHSPGRASVAIDSRSDYRD